jgi:hypothetical protein
LGLKHKRLSDEEWWEKHEAAAKGARKHGPRRVGCEGSESVDDLTNDSLYVACNSMGKGATIEMNNMGSSLLTRVLSAPKLDGQDTDSPREMVVKGGKVVAGDDFSGTVKDIANVLKHERRGARAVKSALKRFRSISIRDQGASSLWGRAPAGCENGVCLCVSLCVLDLCSLPRLLCSAVVISNK